MFSDEQPRVSQHSYYQYFAKGKEVPKDMPAQAPGIRIANMVDPALHRGIELLERGE